MSIFSRRSRKVLGAGAVAVLALGGVSACGLQSGSTLSFTVSPGAVEHVAAFEGESFTVGSKEFTEQVLLGYILAYSLSAAGASVQDLTGIVGSRSTRDAQISGQVDLTYEYTGNGWINYLGNETPIADPHEQFIAVRDADREKFGMDWVAVAPMDNTYGLAASRATLAATGVRTLSDYAELARTNPEAASTCVETEFNVRQDGFPGLAERYEFDAAAVPRPNLQTGLIYQATADARDCQFGEIYTTDGRIPGLDLVVLEDDRNFFPNYNPAVSLPLELSERFPQIEEQLQKVSDRLTNEEITDLNRRVDIDGENPQKVARDWLVRQGLVGE